MSFPSVPSPAFHHRLTFKLSLKRSQLLPNPGQHLATSVVWVQMQLAAWVWQKETDSWVQEEKQAAEEAPPIFIYLFIYFVPEPFILLCSLLRKSKGTSGRTEEAWVRAHGWYSSRYRVAVVWTLSCKACRWSSKCLSNIYQSRGASAACKRRWNSGGRNSHSVRSLSPRFSLCLSTSPFIRHACHKHTFSFWFTRTLLWASPVIRLPVKVCFSCFHLADWRWAVRWWWVRTVVVAVDCVKPDRPQSTSLAAADSMGEISASSPSTATATACESPRARCTLHHPFTVPGWLPISPVDTCARTREHKRVPRWTHKVSKHRKVAQRGMPTLLFTHCCVGQNMMQRCITPASSCNMLSALVPNINPWIKTCGS